MLYRLVATLALFATSAHAHITLNPREAAATYSYHDIRVPHGCGVASTTSITVTIPEGASSVKPEISGDWTIDVAMRPLDPPIDNHGTLITETIDQVTYNFAFPIKNEFVFNAGLQVKYDGAAPGGTVFYFPVTQFCEDGSNQPWDELPDPVTGERPAHPAPTVTIIMPEGLTGHEGHGDTTTTTPAEGEVTDVVDHSAHDHDAVLTADAAMDSTLVTQSATHPHVSDDDDWTSTDTMAVVAVAIAVVSLLGLAQLGMMYAKIQATLVATASKSSHSSNAGTESEPALAPSTCDC